MTVPEAEIFLRIEAVLGVASVSGAGGVPES